MHMFLAYDYDDGDDDGDDGDGYQVLQVQNTATQGYGEPRPQSHCRGCWRLGPHVLIGPTWLFAR